MEFNIRKYKVVHLHKVKKQKQKENRHFYVYCVLNINGHKKKLTY